MRIRNLNHSTYQHQYHIVWGTKYRKKILKPYVKKELIEKLYEITKEYPTLYIHAVNVDEDHVHLQIEIPPNIAVSKAIQVIKSKLSLHLQKKFKFINKMYLENNMWSVGYFSSTIGINEKNLKRYIEHQGKQDLSQQFTFEFS